MTKYVDTGRTGTHRAQIKLDMLDRVDVGEHAGMWTPHEIDVPPRDAFPTGWGNN
jgi:hypothetical protein